MRINELIKNGDSTEVITREMTAEEEAAFLDSAPDEPTDESGTDALKEMITAMSTASTIAQMRNAAKEFLTKTELHNIKI